MDMKYYIRGLASLLCCFALVLTVSAKKKADGDPQSERKRALHALDRLTYGPRPGDVDAVATMGVEKWIERQLHPEKIDNSALDRRLAWYRTLPMSSRELALNFPSQPMLKAVQNGKLALPGERYQHAVYTANLVRLEDKKDAKQAMPMPANVSAGSALPMTSMASEPKAATVDADGFTESDKKQRSQLLDQLIALDPGTRMNRILGLSPQQQNSLTRGLPEPRRQALLNGLTPEQRETVLAMANPTAVVDGELQSAKLLRAVYSDRQLEEVLTDFWFNHFNVYLGKGGERYVATAYEREVIRPHALGKFKDLLMATAQSPAMLFYLDNWQSVGPHSDEALGVKPQNQKPPKPNGQVARWPWSNAPWGAHPVAYPPKPRQPAAVPAQNAQAKRRGGLNENYARELMELHTLGVNGGYTQQDVTEVARVFTGWTLQDPRDGGGFVFKPQWHEPGVKKVLGHKIKENGEKEGYEVLNLLAHSPSTARFVSTKLAVRFVSDNPPPSLINAMSKTFLKSDGDLREVLRTMFHSQEFWAPESYNAKVKTPLEYVASSLRATQAEIGDPQPLIGTLNQMGMPLYGCQPPTGYSTTADAWVNSAALLARMNFALALVNNKVYGTNFDLAALTGKPESDPYQAQVKLEQVLLDGEISANTHQTIESQAAGMANPSTIAALLLGSPEFQRR
jgi:uncharacterized protein (DUF1800 family)